MLLGCQLTDFCKIYGSKLKCPHVCEKWDVAMGLIPLDEVRGEERPEATRNQEKVVGEMSHQLQVPLQKKIWTGL